jgi:hypothetical protein
MDHVAKLKMCAGKMCNSYTLNKSKKTTVLCRENEVRSEMTSKINYGSQTTVINSFLHLIEKSHVFTIRFVKQIFYRVSRIISTETVLHWRTEQEEKESYLI